MHNVHAIAPATEPDPIPLTAASVPATPFPTHVLPAPVAAMVAAVAEATQTDEAMAATSALTVLAAAAGGRAEVEARPGWREVLALHTATIARPGERKSAVQAAMVSPVLDVEEQLAEHVHAHRVEVETQRAVAERRAEAARQTAGKVEGPGRHDAMAEAISARAEVDALVVPPVPRIVADDVTPEAAGSLLAEQGGRLAIISAEGGIFDVLAGRYSTVPNLDVFLKGHAGDPIRVDRRGRPPEYVRRPALTVGVMIQPTILGDLGRNASFRGRGLLARFLYARPVSKVGRRIPGAPPVPQDVTDAYAITVRALTRGLIDLPEPAVIPLDVDAADALVELEARVEPDLAEDGPLGALADWGSKLVGATVRVAGLIHLTEHGPTEGTRRPIDAATLARATEVATYYRAQAVAVFAEMSLDDATRDAEYLLGRVATHDGQTVTVRELQRLARRFRTRGDLDAPLGRLVDNGWLIPVETEHHGPGRPPSPAYTIHPATRRV